jgi:hypothetical protein
MKQINRFGFAAGVTIFIGIAIIMANCKKNTLEPPTAENVIVPGFASSCGEALAANTVLGLIRNDHDPIDDKITLIQYHYAQALRQLMKNPIHRCSIVNAISSGTDPNGISLHTFAQGNTNFAAALNTELRHSINATSSENIYPRGASGESGIDALRTNSNWDANSYLKNKIVYSPYSYDPTVYFVKIPSSCEVTGPVTVLVAQDVNDCDDVAGWRGDDEVVMSELDVQRSDEIVIFVGPGKSVYIPNLLTDYSETNLSQVDLGITERSPGDIVNTARQINNGFRYESSGKSELQGGTIYYNLSPNSTAGSEMFFTKISKDKIESSTNFTSPPITLSVCPSTFLNSTSKAYCILFEKDWWASSKTISNPCGDTGFDAHMKAKFDHEWYMRDCGLFSDLYPSVGFTRTITGFSFSGVAKGTFSFTRVN